MVWDNLYIAMFPAGCYEIVARQLKTFRVPEVELLGHDQSSVSFTSSLTIERLIEFRFFANIYLVLDKSRLDEYKTLVRGSSYRLLSSVDGEPSPISSDKMTALKTLIEEKLGLKPNAQKLSTDFVLLKRTGQEEVLTLKLPRIKHKREQIPIGALRPELTHLLLLISGIKAKDSLLDPFAGYGSIPLEAIRGFGVKDILAVEKDSELFRRLTRVGIKAIVDDATQLASVLDGSIDRVVTDPPWGIYDASIDLKKTYHQSLGAISRVLKPGGIAVILSGSKLLDEVACNSRDLELLKMYQILVSGKQANIIKLRKQD